jgi:hypothetical protein
MAAAEPDQLTQARDALVNWERTTGLAAHRWRGVPLWRLVRNRVIEERLSGLEVRGRSNHNRAGLRGALSYLCGAALSILHLARLRPARWLFIGFPRRTREAGAWVDPFSDPLIRELGEDAALCIEKPFFGAHWRPARTRRLVYFDWALALSVAASYLFGWTSRIAAGRQIDALADGIATLPGTDRDGLRRLIGRELVRFRVESAIMRAVLAIVKPRAVVLTSRWVHLPLIHAARRAGATVLELQHGVPNERGFKYSTLPDPAVDPDRMLTFGSFWDGFDWGLPADRVEPIGFPYIWRRRAELGRASGMGRWVMLVSQPEMAAELSAVFASLAAAHPDVQFLLKLHPQDTHEWRRRYPFAAGANVTACDDASTGLYELFSDCRAVIGHNSTVLFEASFFGLRVGILNLHGNNPCPALRYAGRFNFFEMRSLHDLEAVLRAPAAEEAGNPFLADFDRERFDAAVRRPGGGGP